MPNAFTSGKRSEHMEETRKKIQAAQIINRLSKCVMGEVELTTVQVTAAKALLNKVLPDLQSTQMTADVKTNYAVGDTPQMTKEEWAKQFGPSLH